MSLFPAETFRNIVSGRRRGLFAGTVRALLTVAEPIYGSYIARKNRRYDANPALASRVNAPVISVGNLTVGGTGKTPFVIWLAKWFRQQGVEVTLISRGYGQQRGPNDEAREIAATLPGVAQLQNPDRIAAAREALAHQPASVLILDDAFQHRRIARDLDIVLVDALQPFGYGRLLPRGLLREPVGSLARAQVVALSRADAVSADRREEIQAAVAQHAPGAIWLELVHAPVALIDHFGHSEPLSHWQGKRLAAFAGIGNPAGFEHTLRQCGLPIAAFRALADHQEYSSAVVASLAEWLAAQGALQGVVCTHKDLVKLPQDQIGNIPLRALQIELQITRSQEPFTQLLKQVMASRSAAAGAAPVQRML